MKYFESEILKFHKSHGRKLLPWRKRNISAYEVWVSEIMLQQTQVNRVVDYYNKFIKHFPSIQDLAKTTWEEFLPYYAGLGYYRRGQNMIKTAKLIVDKFGGVFPKNKTELTSLPGIGNYTASAILSFAYGDNHLAFDTNLQKVFGRYIYGNKKTKVNPAKIESKLTNNKKELNAAIMDFANLICTTKPKCNECPLSKKCEYALTEGKNEISLKLRNEKFPTKKAQVFLWLHKEHKEYYSSNPDQFEIFILPPSINTRDKIKKHFRNTYKLELAVRPPHNKTYIQNIPTLFVNAQILLGEHEFGVFKQDEINKDKLKKQNEKCKIEMQNSK